MIGVITYLMKENPQFEIVCYRRSFLYFVRYLETTNMNCHSLFVKIKDSFLEKIGENLLVCKLKRRQKVALDKGGMLISGSVSFKTTDKVTKKSLTRVTFSQFGIIPPCSKLLKASEDTIILKF
jgi:hypothetical protein